MIKINVGKEEFKLEVITVRKLNQTMSFKKKFEILQAQGNNEEELIEAMLDFICTIFSSKNGDKVEYAFDKDFLLDNLPLKELNNTFNYVINAVLGVFAGEEEQKGN